MGRLPESANNAKEGGALIPMLFLGIPGSGSMALLLGGLVLIGLTPGRTMVTDHVDLVYVIIWSIALANLIGAGICIGLVRPIAALTAVPYTLIAPFMIMLIFFAAFQASRDWGGRRARHPAPRSRLPPISIRRIRRRFLASRSATRTCAALPNGSR